MIRLLTLTLTLLLAACATGPLAPSQQRDLMTACASASAAIRVLAAANAAGKLSDGAQDAVLSAIGIVEPVCGAADPPTLDDLQQQAFAQALAALATHAAEANSEDR